MCQEMFGLVRNLLGDSLVTARLSLIFVVLIRQSASNSPQKTPESSPQAVLRYVLKAAGFALTSSIARTNRSQRSRELVGRMTGGGLISGQDSLVTSSNLGRYSSSFARWRSKETKKTIPFSLIRTRTQRKKFALS